RIGDHARRSVGCVQDAESSHAVPVGTARSVLTAGARRGVCRGCSGRARRDRRGLWAPADAGAAGGGDASGSGVAQPPRLIEGLTSGTSVALTAPATAADARQFRRIASGCIAQIAWWRAGGGPAHSGRTL